MPTRPPSKVSCKKNLRANFMLMYSNFKSKQGVIEALEKKNLHLLHFFCFTRAKTMHAMQERLDGLKKKIGLKLPRFFAANLVRKNKR